MIMDFYAEYSQPRLTVVQSTDVALLLLNLLFISEFCCDTNRLFFLDEDSRCDSDWSIRCTADFIFIGMLVVEAIGA